MKIFKFGGASVKDAGAVKNVAAILKMFPGEPIVAVVSAMGKTTNALERYAEAAFPGKAGAKSILEEIRKYHLDIAGQLFPLKSHSVYADVQKDFEVLEKLAERKKDKNYDKLYDQVVSVGELVSTRIVAAYLSEAGMPVQWMDVREVIRTDSNFREGKVDWEATERNAKAKFTMPLAVTQGFLGCAGDGLTTTLGREGSDYTAAILAYCLDAESVTIWKDVPGVLNADPKWFDDTRLIPQLSYHDAIELSYYGATVIHPKTLKPLQNKRIPLYVRSFLRPQEQGTLISEAQSSLPIPCFIFKVNQMLISISPKDFSFIVEENLSEIFRFFSESGVKINTMQNSAISFSVCVDNDEKKVLPLIDALKKKFRVLYNDEVELVTVRYYDQPTIDRVTLGKNILLEVKSRYTVQMVMKDI